MHLGYRQVKGILLAVSEKEPRLKAVHVAVDVESKEVVALEVTREHVGDNQCFDTLLIDSIQNTGRRLAGVIADGSYDTHNNFKKCEALGTEPVIKIDNNAITIPPPNTYHNRRRGTPPRLRHTQQQLADKNKWKKEKRYGLRWHSEGFFSALKCCYGTGKTQRFIPQVRRNLRRKQPAENAVHQAHSTFHHIKPANQQNQATIKAIAYNIEHINRTIKLQLFISY